MVRSWPSLQCGAKQIYATSCAGIELGTVVLVKDPAQLIVVIDIQDPIHLLRWKIIEWLTKKEKFKKYHEIRTGEEWVLSRLTCWARPGSLASAALPLYTWKDERMRRLSFFLLGRDCCLALFKAAVSKNCVRGVQNITNAPYLVIWRKIAEWI